MPTRREFESFLIPLVSLTASCGSPASADRAPRKTFDAAYLALERTGELAHRERALKAFYHECRLCPRQCGVDRTRGGKGICRSSDRAKVYSAHPHFGEEPPLTGRKGSGTVFFSHCSLLCVHCQNWEIAHRGDGRFVSDETLGRLMVDLQEQGCHNINLVTPTHMVPNIVGGLRHAIARGLRVPLVYNCGGYEPVEIIRLLEGIVDIYLPDYKYTDGAMAAKYSTEAKDYPQVAATAIEEMHRQVGELVTGEQGIAQRGLMVRHLVLPGNIAGTDRFVRFVAERLSRTTYVNIMAQYRPEHRAPRYPELSRRITWEEYRQALRWADESGLTNVATS